MPGDLTVAPSGIPSINRLNGEVELLILLLRGRSETNSDRSILAKSQIFEGGLRTGISHPLISELLKELYHSCFGEKVSAQETYQSQILGFLEQALLHTEDKHEVLALDSKPKGANHFAQIECALQHIEANYANEITIDHLARETKMSPAYFSKVFASQTGKTPRQYIIHKRIEMARRMLVSTELSTQRVAAETGFCSQAHLTRAFAKIMGTTPAKYRSRVRISKKTNTISEIDLMRDQL